jgi:hypothetical protein
MKLEKEMDNTRSLTFDDDDSALGGLIYIDRKAFTQYTDEMDHAAENEFNSHLDDLLDSSNRVELSKYPFISLTRPGDFDRTKYFAEPLGPEHIELREWRDEAKAQTAVESAKHHYFLMHLCGHPAEFNALRSELTLSDEELCKIRGISNPDRLEAVRKGIASTIRQVERVMKKYSTEEVSAANAFLADADRQLGDIE